MQTERQKEIIKVALELIAKKGIQGLKIKNLANSIGITEHAIYRHYENNIHILLAILDEFMLGTEQIFSHELELDCKATEKIEHLFTNHYTSFAANPPLVAVIFSEEIFRNEPILIEKISEIMAKNNKTLLSIITNGQKNGEIRKDIEAQHLVVIVMGSLRVFVKKWQNTKYSFDLVKEGQKLVDSIKLLIVK